MIRGGLAGAGARGGLGGVDGGGGASVDAYFVLRDALASLANAQDLSALADGILKHAVVGGISTLAKAIANTDYLAPDWDVISRQTLGADALDLSFTINGNTDERVVIEGRGRCGENGSATLRINDAATAVTYGGSNITDGTLTNENTYLMTNLDVGDFGFTLVLDALNMGASKRLGVCDSWNVRDADGSRVEVRSMFHWANTADNITTVVIRGAANDHFKSGFKAIARRRKFS